MRQLTDTWCKMNPIGSYRKALRFANSSQNSAALPLLESASENGYGPAQYALGTWYLHGVSVEINVKRAADLFEKSVRSGFKGAMYDYAVCLETGNGVKKNLAQASKLYLAAAIARDKSAYRSIARVAYWGIGMDRDLRLARKYYRLAALSGCADSAEALAFMYENGEGGLRSIQRADEWTAYSKQCSGQGKRRRR